VTILTTFGRGETVAWSARDNCDPFMSGSEEEEDDGVELTLDEEGVIPYEGVLDTSFRSFPLAFSFDESILLSLRKDCQSFHMALSKENNKSYSEGTTFWFSSQSTPRCTIEHIVKSVFDFHTKDAKYTK
jgi:hypothetical protein